MGHKGQEDGSDLLESSYKLRFGAEYNLPSCQGAPYCRTWRRYKDFPVLSALIMHFLCAHLCTKLNDRGEMEAARYLFSPHQDPKINSCNHKSWPWHSLQNHVLDWVGTMGSAPET